MPHESVVGQLVKLSDLVDYQREAIVSRTLLRKPAGMVVLFAFDAGQELSEHTSPYEVLVLALEGEADFTLSGKTFPMKAGDMLLIPPNAPHALKAISQFKMLLIMVRP